MSGYVLRILAVQRHTYEKRLMDAHLRSRQWVSTCSTAGIRRQEMGAYSASFKKEGGWQGRFIRLPYAMHTVCQQVGVGTAWVQHRCVA